MSTYLKWLLGISGVCLCFIFGWMIGRSTIKDDPITDNNIVFTESTERIITEEAATEALAEEEAVATYCIISEDDSIYLYEVKSGDRSVIASEEVEIELLPADDAEMLKKGIESTDYSVAVSIWEGYIS